VGRGVEELVRNAEDSALADGSEVVPASLGAYSFERDAGTGSAPGEEEDVWIGSGDVFWSGVGSGCAEVAATRGFDEFGDPRLGVDERLSPLFAVDSWCMGALRATESCRFDGGLHLGDEGFAFELCVDYCGDEANVFVDIG
jgi:hypothetical protein